MPKLLTLFMLLATLPGIARADAPAGVHSPSAGAVALHIEGELQVTVKTLPFKIVAAPGATLYIWSAPDGVKATKARNVLTVSSCPKGTHVFRVLILKLSIKAGAIDVDEDSGEIAVTVGDAPPVPPGPKPPGPNPPDPPGPAPSPAPIPAEGLHVLIVYESAEKNKMPAAQLLILHAQPIREYLNAKCPAGPIAGQKEWWILDKDTDVSALPQKWQDAMKRPRSGLPWIIVSNGKAGFEGPLPADVNKTLELLRKFGG